MKNRLDSFLNQMSLALRQAGVTVNALRGKMENIGKDSPYSLGSDDEIHRTQRSALTIVDMIVQEIILLAVSEIPGFDPNKLVLDAEEETPAAKWFESQESEFSLVIDPIDGTYEYLIGSDKYSICVGLIQKGRILTALVFFPARDHLYFLDSHGHARLSTNAYATGLKAAKELSPITNVQQLRVYKNFRVPTELIRDLRNVGFTVCDDTDESISCPDAILACVSGDAVAYISHTHQIRDILLGAILAGVPTGYALDWSGQSLTWPSVGRVPRAVFGVGSHRNEIVKVLRNYV